MDILPGLLSLSQWLDEKGKTIKRNAQDLPGLLASFEQDVQRGAAAGKSAWDASRSVMPGVREAGIREMNAQGQELGGLLGTFAGVGAKTADVVKLAKAKEMAKAGADPVEVWKQTGWTDQFPDGKWRFEISDDKARIKQSALPTEYIDGYGNVPSWKTTDAIEHEGLLAAHPTLGNVGGSFERDTKFSGSYSAPIDHISLSEASYRTKARTPEQKAAIEKAQKVEAEFWARPEAKAWEDKFAKLTGPEFDVAYKQFEQTPLGKEWIQVSSVIDGASKQTTGSGLRDTAKSVYLHELQHAVQKREGFAKGGDPSSAYGLDVMPEVEKIRAQKKALNFDPYEVQRKFSLGYKLTPEDYAKHEKWLKLKEQEDRLLGSMVSPYEAYRRLAGEAEARLTQARANLTPAERAARPPWLEFDVPREQQIVRGLLGP